MKPAQVFASPPSHGHTLLVLLLVVFCLACSAAPLAAAPTSVTALASAPACVVVGSYFDDIIGNRARMIQVACVLGAIGIFWLTRSYR